MQPILLFNFLPNNKILDWSKWKTPANDKINFAKMMIIFDKRKIIVKKKKENVNYLQFFLLFHNIFSKATFLGFLVWIIW